MHFRRVTFYSRCVISRTGRQVKTNMARPRIDTAPQQQIRSFSTQNGETSDVLNLDKVNSCVKNINYAVRGELAIRAEELRNTLLTNPENLPFKSITSCNIGNPQQLGQKPITFSRQVCALLQDANSMLSDEHSSLVSQLFPADAIERARELKSAIGNVGAYSHSQGIPEIRRHVAEFIAERDGYPSDASHIFLTDGASSGVQNILNLLISSPNTGVMIPIPQYPLYSASLALFNGQAIPYYLNEDDSWGLTADELRESIRNGRKDGIIPRALVVINPGNPTGQVLREEHMRDVIDFCRDEDLVLLADEVYQTNVYDPDTLPFISFKKMLMSMGPTYSTVPLFSFHSISKGVIGECGQRGGYFECVSVPDDVLAMIYKVASVKLCPNVMGQVLIDLMVRPPGDGDISFPLYKKETLEIYSSLKRRAKLLRDCFQSMEGVTCNPAQGSMYLFPQVRFSEKALEAAEKAGKTPDEFYCLAMLNATGVCMVPGSGFGQKSGTFHVRSTFLPPESSFGDFTQKLLVFHQDFMSRYR